MLNLAIKGAPFATKTSFYTSSCGRNCFIALIFFLNVSVHRYDYLRITDGSNNTIGTYCGIQIGKSVRVVGSVALLTFHTDGSVQRRGFQLSFSFFRQSPGELSNVSTTLNCCIDVFLLFDCEKI